MDPESETRIAAGNAAEVERVSETAEKKQGWFSTMLEGLEQVAILGELINVVVMICRGIWIALKALFAVLRVFD